MKLKIMILAVVLSALIKPGSTESISPQSSAIDYEGVLLTSGQLAVTDAPTWLSILFTLTLRDFSPFLHAGVIVIEDGRPFVYETVGKYAAWRNPRPTEAIKGHVRRIPFHKFVSLQKHVEIYDPAPEIDRQAMVDFVLLSHRNKVPFDAFFRTDDQSAYYCTQFVALAIEAGGGPPSEQTAITTNRSVLVLLDWLGIVTPASLIPASALYDNQRYVGTITTFSSRASMHAYLVAKREIHRRFTGNQKLGNVFVLNGRYPEVRPQIAEFVNQAMEKFKDAETVRAKDINREVSSLANEYLGVFIQN